MGSERYRGQLLHHRQLAGGGRGTVRPAEPVAVVVVGDQHQRAARGRQRQRPADDSPAIHPFRGQVEDAGRIPEVHPEIGAPRNQHRLATVINDKKLRSVDASLRMLLSL